ncbi:germacrene A hydroxylase-like [Lolium rigidum]|uniref:germacrene A hydroxylase-like n=1 Tax=Lolium rigidum TaxID=89674 RepID=UPI001F5D01AE|nr:germacrene A hydroxylase-like [Lolium rigidum]
MEAWLSLCFIALITIPALWFLNLSGTKSKPHKPQPPGPWTLPIIGSLHHVISVVPHRKITELCRRHGPLMLLKLGEVPAVIVSSGEAAAQVLKTNDLTFATRPGTPTQDIAGCGGRGIIFAPYGDHWRQMRKVCIVELLSAKQVRRMDGIRLAEVGSLLHYIAGAASTGASVNVSEKMMELSNGIVARAVFGGKFAEQEEYIRELDVVLTLLGGFCLVDLFPSSRLARWLSFGARRMQRSYGCMQRIIENVIEERKAVRAAGEGTCNVDDEDLLDVLLRLQKEDSLAFPLTTESICAVLFDIFSGATDTTGTILEWAMSELVRHPKAMARAQLEIRETLGQDRDVITNSDLTELTYMRMVIKEVLRLHQPAPLIPRMAREDCKILGYDMPKGTTIFINVFAVSRDPKCWKNAEEFVPERFENNTMDYIGTHYEFTPFGAGRRQCPGMLFGTSTLEIVLANLLYHFDWVLPGGTSLESLDMSEKFGITVGRKTDLQLIAIPCGHFKAT